MRSRVWFSLFAAVCVAGAAAYVALAARSSDDRAATLPQQTATRLAADARPLSPHLRLLVRAVDHRDPRLPGMVSTVAPARPGKQVDHGLDCERVYFAAGRGLCLTLARSGVDYRGELLDRRLRPVRSWALDGVPSRARVSSDGRYGSITTFTTGDSYTAAGQFSTRTTLIDMSSGRIISDLERFRVLRDGRPIHSVDFNFWGVTFTRADSDRFYATLGTGTHHYLVEGSVAQRQVRVLRDGVECPSVSPDGKRIAFKKPVDGHGRWRLSVLDLATLREHPLAETRSIDDQAEWLDDDHVAYSDGTDVWSVAADGSGTPQRLVRGAQSPVALRG